MNNNNQITIRDMKSTRYFIVFYVASNKDTGLNATGCMDFTVTDGGYLNGDKTKNIITGKHPNFRQLCFTNIIELSESDYANWSEKEG